MYSEDGEEKKKAEEVRDLMKNVASKVVGLEDSNVSLSVGTSGFERISEQSSRTDMRNIVPFPGQFAKINDEKNMGEIADMDNNKLLEMFIEKVDKDQRDLKEDVRESERRVHESVRASEERNEERMNKIMDAISEQNRKIDSLSEKLDNKVESLSGEVRTGLNEYRKFMWGITFSIFLGVAAMILTMVLTIFPKG